MSTIRYFSIIKLLNRKKERKDIFEDDEEYEAYEGFLPMRARRKARCLTTETVRIWTNTRYLIINITLNIVKALSVLGLTTIRQVR